MSLIVYLIIGGLVGWLAASVGGRDEGAVGSIVIGIVGSFIGGILSRMLTSTDQAYLAFSWVGLAWSFIGALVLVGILNAIQHRGHYYGV